MIDLLSHALDVLQIAHDTQVPHEDPMAGGAGGSGGGASVIVIVAGVVVSLAVVGGLIWLKKRVDQQ